MYKTCMYIQYYICSVALIMYYINALIWYHIKYSHCLKLPHKYIPVNNVNTHNSVQSTCDDIIYTWQYRLIHNLYAVLYSYIGTTIILSHNMYVLLASWAVGWRAPTSEQTGPALIVFGSGGWWGGRGRGRGSLLQCKHDIYRQIDHSAYCTHVYIYAHTYVAEWMWAEVSCLHNSFVCSGER